MSIAAAASDDAASVPVVVVSDDVVVVSVLAVESEPVGVLSADVEPHAAIPNTMLALSNVANNFFFI